MNQLDSNLPYNKLEDRQQYRREARSHYLRGMGTLALAGLGVYGIARHQPFLRTMPEHVAGTMMREPTMLGYGFWEARTPAGYAKMFGLGEHASGVPKWRWIDQMMEVTKRFEEASPSRMLRTFGIYEHLMPLATRRGVTMRFTGQQAVDQLSYLRALTGHSLTETEAAMHGLTLAEGKLHLGKPGEAGSRVILERAHLMMRKYVPQGSTRMAEEVKHFGRLAATYEEALTGGQRLLKPVAAGLAEGKPEAVSSFLIAGGQTPWQAVKRFGTATTRMWSQRFFRLMDDPFLGMMEIMGHYDQDAVNTSRLSKLWERIGFKNRFGLGGKYTGTTGGMFGRWLTPEIMRHPVTGRRFLRPGMLAMAIGLPLIYHSINEFLSDNAQGTAFEAGIPGAAAEGWERIQMARATVGGATGLQRFVRWQEEAAPGTTDPLALAAFPMAGGITGAVAGYARRFVPGIFRDPVKVLESAYQERRLPGFLGRIFKGKLGRTGRWATVGTAIGAAMALPFVPGALARIVGGKETPEELQDIYSGRRQVPVRRGRWWIFGRRKFEGERPEYFIPHWTVRARTRARQEALFGGDEEAGWLFRAIKQTPLLQDLVDPYYFEKLHYKDRPYPVTGPSDIGLGPLDPIYKATIGKVLKPVRYMHREEWMRDGEPMPWEPRPPLAPVAELGGEAPYEPREPYTAAELGRQTAEYYSEAIGIIGWMGRLATRAAFGDVTPYDVRPRMQSAAEIGSIKRAYWDLSLGDPFGTTEAYRRLNPRKNRGQYWNPLQNQMPDWLPGEDYFINFQTGDPYAKIKRGEFRLPGPGYAALHPEMKGIDAEEYSEYHRFKILADVAPYSNEYKYYSKRMTQATNSKAISDQQAKDVRQVRGQVREMKNRKRFHEYKTEEEMKDLDIGQRLMAEWWETAAHLGETPVEQIIFPPIAPMGKFVHQRTALEDYERTQMYGTDLSFWDRPWDNFLRPFLYSAAHAVGFEGIPQHIGEKRDVEEYFDKLEYIKFSRLEAQAAERGDSKLIQQYKTKRRETMAGMNPYGNPLWILRSMPKRERDYWKAFTGETDPEKQKRILDLVPEEIAEAYRGYWLRRSAGDLAKKLKAGQIEGKDAIEAERLIQFVKDDMERQGQPYTKELASEFAAYMEKGKAEPRDYADWYRYKEVESYFESHRLPGPKWIGWDPRVDLEDIKMKLVREEGYDFHDFDVWEDRLYAMTRKPYLDEATDELDMDDYEERPEEVQRRVQELLGEYGATNIFVMPEMNGGRVQIDVNDDQGPYFNQAISRAKF